MESARGEYLIPKFFGFFVVLLGLAGAIQARDVIQPVTLAAFVIVICNPDDPGQCHYPVDEHDPRYDTRQQCEDAKKAFVLWWQERVGEDPPAPTKCKDEDERT